MAEKLTTPASLSDVERIKQHSNYLRGTLIESLADPVTGAIRDDDTQLSKFHGIYMQDDRDVRSERRKQKLEPAYSFMIRVRVPGGIVTPQQWLDLDQLASTHANKTLRITTRQAVQFHGVIKRELQQTVALINDTLLDTLAACGDVNRNVMCTVTPELTGAHAAALELATQLSAHLTPHTRAYHEIWLNGDKQSTGAEDQEPIYGKTYLPRKFKIAVAVPPQNDVDVFANDLGFIAITKNAQIVGYNVTVGGGMGTTHGDATTYARVGSVIGFCQPQHALQVAEAVVITQRDYGDRSNRKHARLKYTIDDRGLEWFKDEVQRRAGVELEAEHDFQFTANGDRYGWLQGADNLWHLTVFIENGRVIDNHNHKLKTGLAKIARIHHGEFRLSGNQNLVIANVRQQDKEQIDKLATNYGLQATNHSALALASIACVGFPTCALAMAESERYLPALLKKMQDLLSAHGLKDEAIVTRMTGCPNGCARPFIAEIGLVGKAPGRYNLHLGGSAVGDRINLLYKENITESEILDHLDALFSKFVRQRSQHQSFGDFVVTTGLITAGERDAKK